MEQLDVYIQTDVDRERKTAYWCALCISPTFQQIAYGKFATKDHRQLLMESIVAVLEPLTTPYQITFISTNPYFADLWYSDKPTQWLANGLRKVRYHLQWWLFFERLRSHEIAADVQTLVQSEPLRLTNELLLACKETDKQEGVRW